MFKNFFSGLSGFDPEILTKLNPKSTRNLELTSASCLMGIVLASVSSAYLFYFSLNSIIIAIFVFAIVFLLLLALQIILITATTGNAQINEKDFEKEPENQYHYILFIIFSFLLAQPLLIFLFNTIKPEFVKNQISQLNLNEKNYQENTFKKNIGQLQHDLTLYERYLKELEFNNQIPKLKESENTAIDFSQNKRKALVIGNQSYATSPLNNPKKDATDISKKLEKIGFAVQPILDGDYATIENALKNYSNQLNPGDISFIYFSGHGFQDHGNNYLVPTDFKPSSDRSKAISLSAMIETISRRFPSASVFVIDACRDGMGKNQGLASIEAGQNTYIALAAEPGKFSYDDKPGSNGFFTKAILENIEADADIDKIFRRVREKVQHLTRNNQLTWTTHNLNTDLVLNTAKTQTSDFVKNLNELDKTGIPCREINQKNYGLEDKLKLQTCIYARYLKTKDDLNNVGQVTFKNNNLIETNNSEEVLAAYSAILKNFPFAFTIGMILITSLLSCGFVLRHRLRKEFNEYEALFHSEQRSLVIKQAKKYLRVAELLPYSDKSFISYAFSLIPNNDRKISSKVLRGNNAIEALLKKYKKKS
jgi:hypothetical protein